MALTEVHSFEEWFERMTDIMTRQARSAVVDNRRVASLLVITPMWHGHQPILEEVDTRSNRKIERLLDDMRRIASATDRVLGVVLVCEGPGLEDTRREDLIMIGMRGEDSLMARAEITRRDGIATLGACEIAPAGSMVSRLARRPKGQKKS